MHSMPEWHSVPHMRMLAAMSTATQLFTAYGIIILIVGFSLGSILGMLRMKSPSLRNLAMAHVETLMQGAMHLGLGFAVSAVAWDTGWATAGAILLVVGSAMQALGVTLNWITSTGDQFAEKSPGYLINSTSTFVIFPGLIITAIGVLTNL